MTPPLKSNGFHLPYDRSLVAKAKQMRQNPTLAENKLWSKYLRYYKPRFLRQRPIAYFIVDFYCASYKLVIEVDGECHFTPEAQEYDRERTTILEGYGLTVIRFTNDEVINNFEGVCGKIESLIPPSPPLPSFQVYVF